MPIFGSKANWKRENIQDHKFDYVDVKQFVEPGCAARFTYSLTFLAVLKSVLMYSSDLFTAGNIIFNKDSRKAYFEEDSGNIQMIVFLISIAASFIILFYELYKARKIMLSRDISFTYTNIIAHRIYTLGSYYNYCFFQRISYSQSFSDIVAFYIFFTLKGWKRFLFADTPREVIKFLSLLKRVYIPLAEKKPLESLFLNSGQNYLNRISFIILALSNIIYIITAISVVLAAIMYIPLLCHIQGNLKEYCCHRVDKRISQLLRHQRLQRQAETHLPQLNRSDIPLNSMKSKQSALLPTLPDVHLGKEEAESESYDDFPDEISNSSTSTLKNNITLNSNSSSKTNFRPRAHQHNYTPSQVSSYTRTSYSNNSYRNQQYSVNSSYFSIQDSKLPKF